MRYQLFQRFLKRTKTTLVFLCLSGNVMIGNLTAQSASPPPLYEMRGVWIATVANIDWPSRPGLDSETQQRELLRQLDQHQQSGINAIMFQVRPAADAFFKDGREPWSYYLTGQQGQAPDPVYDPLAFATEEAHRRGMELHAWFNPYRASQDSDLRKRSEDHISFEKPEWFFEYDNKTYFDPGIPEVRDYITEVVLDVVRRYDIDGVHFDDYFYPYPGKNPLPDTATYEKYGAERFESIEDWRRDNVDQLIRKLHEAIDRENFHVKFGISPFAIWRNKKDDPSGSDTNGFSSFEGLFADVRKWLKEGWIDYVNPQIYFPFGYPPAAYEKLLEWWDENSFGKHVYIGQAAYRATAGKDGWEDRSQLPRQVRMLREKKNVNGSVYFSSRSLINNLAGFADSLGGDLYRFPALPPPVPWLDDIPPAPVENMQLTLIEDRFVRLRWDEPEQASDGEQAYGYVIYRFSEGKERHYDDPENIIGINYFPENFYFDVLPADGGRFFYAVRALDRLKNLSDPGPEAEARRE